MFVSFCHYPELLLTGTVLNKGITKMDKVYTKAALYARVSTDMQAEKNSSIPAQKDMLVSYAQNILHVNDYVFFEDPGYTGTNLNRPAFQNMMERIRNDEFTHLIVFKIDRISRKLLDFAEIYEELKQHKVSFVSLQENFDSSTIMGEAMIKVTLLFAELEVNNTRQRVKTTMVTRAEKAKFNGGKYPFGIRKITKNGEVETDPEEYEILQMMFRLFVNRNMTAFSLAIFLNQSHIPAPKGKIWYADVVQKILSNPIYIGTYIWNRIEARTQKKRPETEWIISKKAYQPILPKPLWEAAQARLRSLKLGGYHPAAGLTHVFSHILICGECGKLLSASKYERLRVFPRTYSLYRCNNYMRHLGCRNKIHASDITLGNFVFPYLINLIRLKEEAEPLSPRVLEKRLLTGLPAGTHIRNLPRLFADYSNRTDAGYTPLFKPPAETMLPHPEKTLEEQLAKNERALKRLKSLYLYSDSAMGEEEFLTEQKEILSAIKSIQRKLSRYREKESERKRNQEQKEWEAKAFTISLYALERELEGTETFDYAEFLSGAGEPLVFRFVHDIFQKIVIQGSHVISITFKNGAIHEFSYKEPL